MKDISIRLIAVAVCCSLATQFSAAQTARTKETVLYSFAGSQDGISPKGGLINVKGMLYGTTVAGGSESRGVLFSVDRHTGAEKVLLQFFRLDLDEIEAGLIDLEGTLYGTSGAGGSHGAIFSFDPTNDAATVIYAFPRCRDGVQPLASLIDVKRTLYGTTVDGGALGCRRGGGTVFSLDASRGTEKVLYSFCSKSACADGSYPAASLIDVNGRLYGTTEYGGSHGYGTVFTVDRTTGAETVLYSFSGGADGALPSANPIYVNGILYGTTSGGGAYGGGTVFFLDPNTGAEKVVHSFGNGTDGKTPYAGLLDVNGTLYGTTAWGGSYDGGTAFRMDPSTSAFKVIHSFGSGTDGSYPGTNLIDVNGTLYGTTAFGGAYRTATWSAGLAGRGPACCAGYGTVFALKNP